jgi:hypothetical protein
VPKPAWPTAIVRRPRRSKPRASNAGGVKNGVREPYDEALTTNPPGLRRATTVSKKGGMLSIAIRSNRCSCSKFADVGHQEPHSPDQVRRLGLGLRNHLRGDVYADNLAGRVAIGQLKRGGARAGADVEDAGGVGLHAIERGHQRRQVVGRVPTGHARPSRPQASRRTYAQDPGSIASSRRSGRPRS